MTLTHSAPRPALPCLTSPVSSSPTHIYTHSHTLHRHHIPLSLGLSSAQEAERDPRYGKTYEGRTTTSSFFSCHAQQIITGAVRYEKNRARAPGSETWCLDICSYHWISDIGLLTVKLTESQANEQPIPAGASTHASRVQCVHETYLVLRSTRVVIDPLPIPLSPY